MKQEYEVIEGREMEGIRSVWEGYALFAERRKKVSRSET
jgi:hypothetical protein